MVFVQQFALVLHHKADNPHVLIYTSLAYARNSFVTGPSGKTIATGLRPKPFLCVSVVDGMGGGVVCGRPQGTWQIHCIFCASGVSSKDKSA